MKKITWLSADGSARRVGALVVAVCVLLCFGLTLAFANDLPDNTGDASTEPSVSEPAPESVPPGGETGSGEPSEETSSLEGEPSSEAVTSPGDSSPEGETSSEPVSSSDISSSDTSSEDTVASEEGSPEPPPVVDNVYHVRTLIANLPDVEEILAEQSVGAPNWQQWLAETVEKAKEALRAYLGLSAEERNQMGTGYSDRLYASIALLEKLTGTAIDVSEGVSSGTSSDTLSSQTSSDTSSSDLSVSVTVPAQELAEKLNKIAEEQGKKPVAEADGNTLRLLTSVSLTAPLTIEDGMTLDLNGKSIFLTNGVSGPTLRIKGGDVKIKNGSVGKNTVQFRSVREGETLSGGSAAVEVAEGTTTIEHDAGATSYLVKGTGSLILKDGATVSSNDTPGVEVQTGGTLFVEDGATVSGTAGITVSGGTVTIGGGDSPTASPASITGISGDGLSVTGGSVTISGNATFACSDGKHALSLGEDVTLENRSAPLDKVELLANGGFVLGEGVACKITVASIADLSTGTEKRNLTSGKDFVSPGGITYAGENAGQYEIKGTQITAGSSDMVYTLAPKAAAEEKWGISYTLNHLDVDGGRVTEIAKDGALRITLVADSGFVLPDTVTVTMEGTTGTDFYTYANGTITVAQVTGNVAITAAGTEQPTSSENPKSQDASLGTLSYKIGEASKEIDISSSLNTFTVKLPEETADGTEIEVSASPKDTKASLAWNTTGSVNRVAIGNKQASIAFTITAEDTSVKQTYTVNFTVEEATSSNPNVKPIPQFEPVTMQLTNVGTGVWYSLDGKDGPWKQCSSASVNLDSEDVLARLAASGALSVGYQKNDPAPIVFALSGRANLPSALSWKNETTPGSGGMITGLDGAKAYQISTDGVSWSAAQVDASGKITRLGAGTYYLRAAGNKNGDGGTAVYTLPSKSSAQIVITAYTAPGNTPAPAFVSTTAQKKNAGQAYVEFTLASAPPAGATFQVYGSASDTSPLAGYRAAASGTTLTLSHAPDAVAARSYWVSATAPGSGESARIQLTVTAASGEGSSDVKVETEVTDGNTPQVSLPNGNSLKEAVLTDDDYARIAEGANVTVTLAAQALSESAVPPTDVRAIKDELGHNKIGLYLDLTLYKQIGNGSRTPVSNLNRKIPITVEVPEELRLRAAGKTRVFSVIRVHNGLAETLSDTDSNEETVTIFSDRCSTYALVYRDQIGGEEIIITARASSGGTITPSGKVTVIQGDNATFTITPDAGYRVEAVVVDGSRKVELFNGQYTFGNVREPYTIDAYFVRSDAPASDGSALGIEVTHNPGTGVAGEILPVLLAGLAGLGLLVKRLRRRSR